MDSRESPTRATPNLAADRVDLGVVAVFQSIFERDPLFALPVVTEADGGKRAIFYRPFTVREETGADGRTRAIFGRAVHPPSPFWKRFEKIAACSERERGRRAEELAHAICDALYGITSAVARLDAVKYWRAGSLDAVRVAEREVEEARSRMRADPSAPVMLESVVGVLSTEPARTNGGGFRPPYPSPLHLARALAAAVLDINRKTVRRRTRIEVGQGGLTTSVFVRGKRPRPPWPGSVAVPAALDDLKGPR